MQKKSPKQLFAIALRFDNDITRTVKVKATTREKAEERALKFNPAAIGIKRGA